MLLRFKLCIFLFLLWFFFTLKRYLAKMKSRSFCLWLNQLCPVLGKSRSHWLFVHIHKFLHTLRQANYHQAKILLNFQRPSFIELDGVNPTLFHCNCLNYAIFFTILLICARYTQPSKNHYISSLTQPTVAISWKDRGFCNYLFIWRISVIFIIYLQAPKLS